MEVNFTPSFVRMYKKLHADLKIEVKEKVELLKDESNHKMLKVHKLSGILKGRYAYSVNYKIRIVFTYTKTKPRSAILLAIGDHDMYK